MLINTSIYETDDYLQWVINKRINNVYKIIENWINVKWIY